MKKVFKCFLLFLTLGLSSLVISSCQNIENEQIIVNYLADEGGTISGSSQQKIFTWQKTETVKAVPDENHAFVNWTVDVPDYTDNFKENDERSDTFTNTLIKEYNFTAHFSYSTKIELRFEAGEGGAFYSVKEGDEQTPLVEKVTTVTMGNNLIKLKAIPYGYAEGYYSFSCWKKNGEVVETKDTLVLENVVESANYYAEFTQHLASAKIVIPSNQEGCVSFNPKDKEEKIDVTKDNLGLQLGFKIDSDCRDHIEMVKWKEKNTGEFYNLNYGTIDTDFRMLFLNDCYIIEFKKVTKNYEFEPVFQSDQLTVGFKVADGNESFGFISGMTTQNIPYNGRTEEVTASLSSVEGNSFYSWAIYLGDEFGNLLKDGSGNPILAEKGVDYQFINEQYNVKSEKLVLKNVKANICAVGSFEPSFFVKFKLPNSLLKGYNGTTNDFASLKEVFASEGYQINYNGSIRSIDFEDSLPEIQPQKSNSETTQVTETQLNTFKFLNKWDILNSAGNPIPFFEEKETSKLANISTPVAGKTSFLDLVESKRNLIGDVSGSADDPFILVPRLDSTKSNYIVKFSTNDKRMGLITSPVKGSSSVKGTDDASQVDLSNGYFSKIVGAADGKLFSEGFVPDNIQIRPFEGYALDYIYEANSPEIHLSFEDFITIYKGATSTSTEYKKIQSDLNFIFQFKETTDNSDFSELPDITSNKDSFNSLLKIILNKGSNNAFETLDSLFREVTVKSEVGHDESPIGPLTAASSDTISQSLATNSSKYLKNYDASAKATANKGSLVVGFGGLKWHAVYFENVKRADGSFDPILTLWLGGQKDFGNTFKPNNSYSDDRKWPSNYSNTFLMDMYSDNFTSSIEKYGQVYSRISSLKGDNNAFKLPQNTTTATNQVPTIQYGQSGLSVNTLSNEGSYYEWVDNKSTIVNDSENTFENNRNNPFIKFTRGEYSKYIGTPYTSSSYQSTESRRKMFNTSSGSVYDDSNDAYNLTNLENDDLSFPADKKYLNFSNMFNSYGANSWKDHKLWIPSVPEAVENGIWKTTQTQRSCGVPTQTKYDMYANRSTYWVGDRYNYIVSTTDSSTVDKTHAVPGTLLRSYSDTTKSLMQLYLRPENGELGDTYYTNVVGIRPCLLLNLRSIFNNFNVK